MFVKFDCDCVGLVVDDGAPIVIDPCDLNHPECWEPIQFQRRGPMDKPHTPLPTDRVESYVKEINTLISDGYAFRKVRDLLDKPKI